MRLLSEVPDSCLGVIQAEMHAALVQLGAELASLEGCPPTLRDDLYGRDALGQCYGVRNDCADLWSMAEREQLQRQLEGRRD